MTMTLRVMIIVLHGENIVTEANYARCCDLDMMMTMLMMMMMLMVMILITNELNGEIKKVKMIE